MVDSVNVPDKVCPYFVRRKIHSYSPDSDTIFLLEKYYEKYFNFEYIIDLVKHII